MTTIILNPTRKYTYWSALDVLGLIALFAVLPRLVRRDDRHGIQSVFFGNILAILIPALAATIPPLLRHGDVFTAIIRTNNAFPVLILAQAAAIYYIAVMFTGKLGFGRWAADIMTIGMVMLIFVLSFGEIWF